MRSAGISLLLALHTAHAQTTFTATSRLVLVPVNVTDKSGKSVDGLNAADFELIDQGEARRFDMESSSLPISVVVAVQSNSNAGPAIAKIQKTGAMFHPLVAGERGEVALVTYSDRVTLRQDFTRDASAISEAFRRMEPDGVGASMNDAVLQSVRMLAARQAGAGNRRRVVIVIGESKDRSSETKVEEAISAAQAANVVIYPVSYSVTWTSFTSRGAEQFSSGKPVYSSTGGLIEIFSEIGRAGAKNGHEALAKYTGGMKNSFVKLRGLEETIQKAGEDLHSQYLLSFQPKEGAAGYRELRVKVRGCAECMVRHRPGYWKSE